MGRSATENYEFDRVSQSQIGQFQLCKRRWFFSAPMNIDFARTDAMKFSSECHRDVEKILKGERGIPETAEVAELMDRGLLPDDPEWLAVEQPIADANLQIAGVDVTGTLDAAWLPRGSNRPIVNDWKFRANTGYESEETVREGVQLNLYSAALAEMLGWDDDQEIELRLTEILKESEGGPAAEAITVLKTVDEVCTRVRELEHYVHQMREYADTSLEHVPRSPDSCYTFGQCQYYDMCWAVDHEPVSYHEEDQVVDDVDNLLNDLNSADNNSNNEQEDGPVDPDDVELDGGPETEPSESPSTESEPSPNPRSSDRPSIGASDVFGEFTKSNFDAEFVSELDDNDGLRIQVAGRMVDLIEAGSGAVFIMTSEDERTRPMRSASDLLAKFKQIAGKPSDAERMSEEDVEELNEAAKTEEVDAPTNDTDAPVTAPDQAPEEEPSDLDGIAIENFDWQQIKGIGQKNEQNILDWFEDKPYETLADLLESSFNFQDLPHIGRQKAPKVRELVEDQSTFEPENVESGEMSARKMQKRVKMARQRVEDEGGAWNSDVVDEDDVRSVDSAGELAKMVMRRTEKKEAKAAAEAVQETDESSTEDEHDWASESDEDAGSLELFINCVPLRGARNGKVEDFHDLCDELGIYEDAVEMLNSNDDIDVEVEYWNAAPYGKGPKALAGAVLRRIDEFDGRSIVIHDDLPGAKEVIPALRSRAKLVVKDG